MREGWLELLWQSICQHLDCPIQILTQEYHFKIQCNQLNAIQQGCGLKFQTSQSGAMDNNVNDATLTASDPLGKNKVKLPYTR